MHDLSRSIFVGTKTIQLFQNDFPAVHPLIPAPTNLPRKPDPLPVSHPSQDPDPADEALADAQAELLADAWIERAMTDPAIRRQALRAVGLLRRPAELKIDELAAQMGVSRQRLKQISDRALEKLGRMPDVYRMRGFLKSEENHG